MCPLPSNILIEKKCGPVLSFTDTDRLMYGIKMKDVYEDFIRDKKNVWF